MLKLEQPKTIRLKLLKEGKLDAPKLLLRQGQKAPMVLQPVAAAARSSSPSPQKMAGRYW
jgi:hypothetical protein